MDWLEHLKFFFIFFVLFFEFYCLVTLRRFVQHTTDCRSCSSIWVTTTSVGVVVFILNFLIFLKNMWQMHLQFKQWKIQEKNAICWVAFMPWQMSQIVPKTVVWYIFVWKLFKWFLFDLWVEIVSIVWPQFRWWISGFSKNFILKSMTQCSIKKTCARKRKDSSYNSKIALNYLKGRIERNWTSKSLTNRFSTSDIFNAIQLEFALLS